MAADACPTSSFVSLSDVTKRFGPVAAVDGVSLDIRKGEFFSLLGPSGCGKSTLMRLLAGFEMPDAGSIRLDGEDMAGMPPNLRPVNMMFQNYALFPHLTVAGNIAFGLKRMGLDRAALAARLAEMLRLTQLQGLEERKPAALSGGQRQRVALARALARGPKVLLLDEPLAALDRKLRKETQGELKRIQAESGTTFIVVTHDQEEAMTLSDRMAVLRAGRAEQVGTPADIYDRPANRYVASFIGDVNLVPSDLLPDGRWKVRGLDGPLSAEAAPSATNGPAHFAIRPERLRLVDRAGAAPGGWNAVVRERTLLGPAVAFAVSAAGDVDLNVLVPASDPMAAIPPGAEVRVTFAPADARVIGD